MPLTTASLPNFGVFFNMLIPATEAPVVRGVGVILGFGVLLRKELLDTHLGS